MGSDCDAGPVVRLTDVGQKIKSSAAEACRNADGVTLIAVSKTFMAGEIVPVLVAGHRHFGENRVQEAQAKWPALRETYQDVTLHLIGPLQSNKTREAVALFDVIHTVDRQKIAKAIADEMQRQNRKIELFVQINTGEEPQKAGIAPHESAEFLKYCRDDLGLTIKGLMCIPPVDEEPAVHFAFLAKLAGDLGLDALSMGMSDDFETAIAFGATHIRVGSAIFGSRE